MADPMHFENPEQFRAACRQLSARLHHVNRVALGEKAFAHAVAELLTDLGALFDEKLHDTEVQAAFGDGWTPGTLDRKDRLSALVALIEERRG